jgi:hypothetical protein
MSSKGEPIVSDGPFHTRELQRRVDEFDERLTLVELQLKNLAGPSVAAVPSTAIASTEPVKPAADQAAIDSQVAQARAAEAAGPTTEANTAGVGSRSIAADDPGATATEAAPTATPAAAAGNTETVGESRIGAPKPE